MEPMVHPVNLDVVMAVLAGAVVSTSMVVTVVSQEAAAAGVLLQAAGQLMGVQEDVAKSGFGHIR